MKYIVKALRQTYHNERKAYSGLNDLINLLEGSNNECERIELLRDIEDVLKDICESKKLHSILSRVDALVGDMDVDLNEPLLDEDN